MSPESHTSRGDWGPAGTPHRLGFQRLWGSAVTKPKAEIIRVKKETPLLPCRAAPGAKMEINPFPSFQGQGHAGHRRL